MIRMRLAEQYFQRLLYDTDQIEAVSTLCTLWNTRWTDSAPYFGLAIPEYNVSMCNIYDAEVINGGHTQFFFNHGGEITLRVKGALRDLGFNELERILDDACQVFPDSKIPQERESFATFLSVLSEEGLARLDALDEEFYAQDLDVDERLLDYLRAHEQEILLPERGLTGVDDDSSNQ